MNETERMESAPPEQATEQSWGFFFLPPPHLSHFRQEGCLHVSISSSDAGTKEEPWLARLCPCSAGSPTAVCKPTSGGLRRHMHLEDIPSACI